ASESHCAASWKPSSRGCRGRQCPLLTVMRPKLPCLWPWHWRSQPGKAALKRWFAVTLARLQQKKQTEETARSTSRPYLPYKRALDLFICLVSLPFLLVLMGVIALVIMLDSPGSPFFVQERVGKDRRCFRMYKFRTMRCDYDDRQDRDFMRA